MWASMEAFLGNEQWVTIIVGHVHCVLYELEDQFVGTSCGSFYLLKTPLLTEKPEAADKTNFQHSPEHLP
jgi:hypothetical protein